MKTQKIRIERSILIDGVHVDADAEVSVDIETAAQLIRHGRAVKVEGEGKPAPKGGRGKSETPQQEPPAA